MIRFAVASLLSLAVFGAGGADAKTYKLEGLQIVDPVAPATPPNAPATVGGTASLAIENKGTEPLMFLGASSPAAGIVELHQAVQAGRASRTRRVLSLSLYPGDRIEVGPEAEYRLILTGMKQKLQKGETFPLILEFDPLGAVEVMVEIGGKSSIESKGSYKDPMDTQRHNKTRGRPE